VTALVANFEAETAPDTILLFDTAGDAILIFVRPILDII
jgi:hypothetical protein